MLQFIQIVGVFLVLGSFSFNSLKLTLFSTKRIDKYEWRIGMVFSRISHQEGLYLTSD